MMLRTMTALVLMNALAFAAPTTAFAAPLASSRLVATFNSPVYVTSPPGDKHLLFVVEQGGRIWVLDDEVKESIPFLDISSRVSVGAERGLFSIAFPADYATSRLFYIAYTNKNGDVEVDEFRRMATNAKRAEPGTRRLVLSILHRDSSFHNGGQLQFGEDGYLYVSVGDGGGFSPPKGAAARDLGTLLGKILRIDPRRSGVKPYTIPPDNPYVGDSSRRPEIYAYGLRNPWRFSFHGPYMAITDEGEDRQDEVNFLATARVKGVNFGWPYFEGRLRVPGGLRGPDPEKMPMYVHNHTNGRCAIIGGYVVRDWDLPALRGQYIFGDLCGGRIMSMKADVQNQRVTSIAAVGPVANQLTSFGIGPHGAVYYTQFGGSTGGELRRLVPLPEGDQSAREDSP